VKLVIVALLLAAAAVAAPLALDAADATRTTAALVQLERARGERIARVPPAPAPDADPARDAARVARLADALALGKPLAWSLHALAELSARHHLTAGTLAVKPPDRPVPELLEYPVKLAVTGAAADVLRFTQALPDLEAPVRIRTARLAEGPSGARLELELAVLVE